MYGRLEREREREREREIERERERQTITAVWPENNGWRDRLVNCEFGIGLDISGRSERGI
jgi:hypothetical protein